MRTVRVAEQALRLAAEGPRQKFVCQSCRIQAARQFSTSVSRHEENELPWFRKMQNSLFGTKESRQSEEKREVAKKERMETIAKAGPEAKEQTVTYGDNTYRIAAEVNPEVTKDYVEALNWNGLKRLGSEEWVKKRADKGEQYYGFVPPNSTKFNDGEWQLIIHNIMLEILLLKKAGRNLMDICNRKHGGSFYAYHLKKGTIEVTNGGTDATVTLQNDTDKGRILTSMGETPKEDALAVTAQNFRLVQNIHKANKGLPSSAAAREASSPWMHLQLDSPETKLAIAKRILQITGKRVPDSVLSASTTVSDIFHAYKTPETPKKLYQRTEVKQMKNALPNVKVYKRRQTPVHQEKAIGRWKIIEEELQRRGLPTRGVSTKYRSAKAIV